jgi:malonyl-CoA/methylmalonyl-CoA synthetase
LPDNLFARFVAAAPDLGRDFLRPVAAPALAYREVFATAARFAHVLTRHGAKPGDRVAVQVEKSPAALILYLTCLRAGFVYLPLNTGYTPAELAYFVRQEQGQDRGPPAGHGVSDDQR